MNTLTSVGNPGLQLDDLGKLDFAEHFLRRALVGRERTLGRDHPSTIGDRVGRRVHRQSLSNQYQNRIEGAAYF